MTDFAIDKNIIIGSSLGMIKKTRLSDFKVSRYSKTISCMKLKENDYVVGISLNDYSNIMITTYNGYNLWFDEKEVPESGIKSSGVKAIKLKDDYVVSYNNFKDNLEYLTIFTDKESAKRVKLLDLEKGTRARKGILIIREVKSNPHKVKKSFAVENKTIFGLRKEQNIDYLKSSELPILDRYKTGSIISKEEILNIFPSKILEKSIKENKEETDNYKTEELEKEEIIRPVQISLLEIDDELDRIDDILKNK